MRSISAVFMLVAGSAFAQLPGELLISGGPALPSYSFGTSDPHTFGTSMKGHVGLNMDVGFLMPLAADTVKTGFRLFLGLGYVRHAFMVNYSNGGNGSGFEAFDTFSTSELQLRLMPRWTLDARQRLWIGVGVGL